MDIRECKYDYETIRKKRSCISEKLITMSANIKTYVIKDITPYDLELLFKLYDEVFLENWFHNNFQGSFKFALSKRMTKSAGITFCPKNIATMKAKNIVIEFRIGVNFFLNYDLLKESKIVCGIESKNSLEALQLVLEHEICHALEYICFYKSSCRSSRFKEITNNLFGHESSYHDLPTNRKLAKETLGISLGDAVYFQVKGNELSGLIYSINKKVAVMVKDKLGKYTDNQGNRYAKYYVALEKIRILKNQIV